MSRRRLGLNFGDPSPTIDATMHAAWDAVRRLLTGSPAPDLRVATTFRRR